jgi:translation initiation factor 1 (eIF-1/SUI1)
MLQRVVRLLDGCFSHHRRCGARTAVPELPDHVVITRDEREQQGPLEGLRAGLSAFRFRQHRVRHQLRRAAAGASLRERMIALLGDHDIAVMEIDGFPTLYRRLSAQHAAAHRIVT